MKLRDKETNKIEQLVSKTQNSYCVTQTKLTKHGISCTQWFTEKDFKKRFEIIK